MSRLSTLVNNDQITFEQVHSPVMATPAIIATAKIGTALVAVAAAYTSDCYAK